MKDAQRSLWPERAFYALALAAVLLPLALLGVLLLGVLQNASERLSLDFITSYPSRKPELAGILPGLVGSLYLMLLTAAIALPIGVGAAIHLEEYGKRSRFARFIELNIANLAGVPSIVYGILGLVLFVDALNRLINIRDLGSLLSGGLTLATLVLPIVVITTSEALRAVPRSLREAAFGVGATRSEVIRHHVLPAAAPGIVTGTVLSLARAFGETAPLLLVGATGGFFSTGDAPLVGRLLTTAYSAVPIQILSWAVDPNPAFKALAAAGIVVMMVILLLINGVAIWLRDRYERAW